MGSGSFGSAGTFGSSASAQYPGSTKHGSTSILPSPGQPPWTLLEVTVTGGCSAGRTAIGCSPFQMMQWTSLILEGLLPMGSMALGPSQPPPQLPVKVQWDSTARPALTAPAPHSTELPLKVHPTAVRFPCAYIAPAFLRAELPLNRQLCSARLPVPDIAPPA